MPPPRGCRAAQRFRSDRRAAQPDRGEAAGQVPEPRKPRPPARRGPAPGRCAWGPAPWRDDPRYRPSTLLRDTPHPDPRVRPLHPAHKRSSSTLSPREPRIPQWTAAPNEEPPKEPAAPPAPPANLSHTDLDSTPHTQACSGILDLSCVSNYRK